MTEQFFYSAEIRRWLVQLIRMFSEFTVQYGKTGPTSDYTYVRVPVTYGDSTRMVQTILANNTENVMQSVPKMVVSISALKYARDRVQNPTFVDTVNVRTRQYNANLGIYEPQQGTAYTLERLMPVPFDLSIKLDIWTSNTQQKLQLLEQILCLFNPSVELQNTDNYFDWTSLSYAELINVNWSSRTIPVDTTDSIDIATIEFKVPIWLTAPARVTKLNAIYKVIASIYTEQGTLVTPSDWEDGDDLLLGTRSVVTFNNYNVFVTQVNDNYQIQLLRPNQVVTANSAVDIGTFQGAPVAWANVLSDYGNVRPGVSLINLNYNIDNSISGNVINDGSSNIISGTIAINPLDPTILLYNNITGIPTNTLPAIDAIINPQAVAPGINGLPTAVTGQAYILTEPVGNSTNSTANATIGWTFGNISTVANTNDIITYNGTNWVVTFNSANVSTVEYVINITSDRQYKWTGSSWVKSIEGLYGNEAWSLVI